MRDFFERQQVARRRARRLLLLFALAVAFIVLGVYLLVSFLLAWHTFSQTAAGDWRFWHPARFVLVTLATLLFIGGGSWYKIRQLRTGGRRVAEILGARAVHPATTEAREARLRNVVEEMALASGVSVPGVYLLDGETGINAFAAGFGLDDAVICVTAGALDRLERDELQGVVAHEFSHLLRRDTELNTRLLGWLHGILLIGLAGQMLLRGTRLGRGRAAASSALFGVALYLLGSIGLFFGRLIKGAVSRQQEFASDAAAVQFTRNPAGLAGALKKVGGMVYGSVLVNPRVAELSHMYFCDGLPGGHLFLFATHPPLAERIRRLEPGFSGDFPRPAPAPQKPAPPAARKRTAVPAAPALTGAAAVAILESVGAPMQAHVERIRSLLASLPAALREATRDPAGARALVFALLLDRRAEVRARQVAGLRQMAAGIVPEVERLTLLGPFSVHLRLPLLDLALPALRTMSAAEYRSFLRAIDLLVAADGATTPFEYALRHRLRRHLAPAFEPIPPPVVQIYSLRGVLPACERVLSLLARAGSRDEAAAAHAFERGAALLREPGLELTFLVAGDCALPALDAALAELERCGALLKRKLLAACLESLTADGHIAVAEAELFRAIADALGCPVPPWLETGADASAAVPAGVQQTAAVAG